ncbi:centlein [Sebastes umbrosus]|uniref:centlein n=1 Tax=Sebastes umbrosus TaxID=72105 RepID=UPI0018A0BDFF|nr:centlein [Sebastes umbrosus]XP_037619858.1 centlein [Sebastes umbrosus]XP_037619859.1 centlein [Sebastes umbrosus]
MSSEDEPRILVLEEQVKSLSDELMQCQADKEFVWSLWKRLQVANPDLTQAVSLVVEREKHKAEIKDRKVLEILQSKDYKIQELEQKVTGQQQEINNLGQRRTTVDEGSALMKKELTALREQLVNNSQELKEMKTECRRREEEERQVVQALKEENKGLTSRWAALRADLEEKERQANSQQDRRDAARDRVKELEEELHHAWQELSRLQSHSSSLSAQLSSTEREVAAKEGQLNQLRCEFAEVQTLYRQSTEHAAEQSNLMKQLEGLNLDTQRVLRNQEEAHTADTTSYQRLYTELSQCYQTLVSSEANLRQSHQKLSDLLVQKDQHILQLQAQLQQQQQQQQQQEQMQLQQQQHSSPNRQTNFKAAVSEQVDAAAQRSSPGSDWAPTRGSDPRPEDKTLQQRSSSSVRGQQGAPVQRSRSLSPASSVGLGSGRRGGAEKKIQDLEELLQLKMAENEELRRAHDQRRERLRLIQTNYKTVRDQLKAMEKSSGLPGGRTQRAQPWQLRQENSDAVWNELAYLKNLTRKLSIEKAGVEEELDMLRVQAAMDRATVKEVHLCLANEHQELLHKVLEERRVKSSTPKKLSVSSERMEQSFKKIEQLERRMVSLEEETERLREEKEQLLEAKEDLAHNCRRLQASLDHLRTQEAVREEATRAQALAQALAQGERHRSEIVALGGRLAASQKETTKLHHQLLKLRQELGILRAARDFYRNRAAAPARAGGIASNISHKVKLRTTRLRGPLQPRSHRTVSPNQAISWRGRSPSPTKDEWEDMSIDSDSGEDYEDSLNSVTSRRAADRRYANRKSYRCSLISNTAAPAAKPSRKHPDVLARDDEQHEPWDRGTGGEERRRRRKRMLMKTQRCSSSSLQQRVESLQRHIDILRSARKDAVLSAKELRRANEEITAQLNSLSEKLCSSHKLTQKLTSDLAGKEQQKKVLEMELEQWRQITLPQQTVPAAAAPVNAECCCQGRTIPAPPNPAPPALEAEVKQLQAKLKSASAEVTRQVAANKALRGQLQEKEDKLRQLQDKASHAERDVSMKRQLVEDFKTRLKFLQEMEKSYCGQVEELEKKVKTLSEEATNRKALVDSLKRRLNVAATEKSQYEASCKKLKEDLEKKEQRMHALQARVGAGEQALTALEQTATEQMEGLTQQSSLALDRLQRQLGQAYSQLEQLHSFIKALASEILLDVQEVKQQLMKRRRLRQANAVAAKGGLSAKSMIKAKSIAASILNMSENDLADIMDTDQGAEARSESPRDQEWLDHLNLILQQKIPSAGQLMEAVRVKMKERKVLTEELATLATPVSEKA